MRKLFTLLSLSALVLLTANLPLAAKGKGNANKENKRHRKLQMKVINHPTSRRNKRKQTLYKKQAKKNRKNHNNYLEQPTVELSAVVGKINLFRVAYDMK